MRYTLLPVHLLRLLLGRKIYSKKRKKKNQLKGRFGSSYLELYGFQVAINAIGMEESGTEKNNTHTHV